MTGPGKEKVEHCLALKRKMSEEARKKGAGKMPVPVLSCNLVEELYSSAGNLVKRGN